MSTSDIVAIVLLFIAVSDTILARWMLPNMLDKNGEISPEQKATLIKLVNGMTFAFAGGGIIVYLTQCFG